MSTKVHVQTVSDDDSIGSEDSDADISDQNEDDKCNGTTSTGKAGLADAMAKILGKQVPKHKQVILAKSKTDKEITTTRVKEKEKRGIDDEETRAHKEHEEFVTKQEKKRLWEELGRVKPDPLQREKEKALQRIAQRGVVQLFNAVRRQQKTIEDKMSEAGPSERKQAKVLQSVKKGEFLDILEGKDSRGNKKSKSKPKTDRSQEKPVEIKTEIKEEEEAEEEDGRQWGALREDYMMGAKMKDWDRHSDDSVDDDDNDDDKDDDSDSDVG